MDVAVFPSTYEAAQYVMLEAMASALPVVTTPAGLAIDLIASGVNGVIIPFHDTEAASEAVEALLADRGTARRIGEAARASILQGYSTDAMVDALASLYLEVTDRHEHLPGPNPPPLALTRSAQERRP
jgi:glycosyltransferase involved in cell wall biosynthesis